MFGNIDNDLFTVQTQDTSNEEEKSLLDNESKEFEVLRDLSSETEFGRRILEKVFLRDIERLARLTDLWKDRDPPRPLELPRKIEVTFFPEEDDYHRKWSIDQLLSVFVER